MVEEQHPLKQGLKQQLNKVNRNHKRSSREFVLSEPVLNLWSGIRENLIGSFEMIDQEKLGGEKLLKRCANCTSIDAMMLGVAKAGDVILFLIEWKYTESYNSEPKWKGDSGQVRLDACDQLLKAEDCPIVIDPEDLLQPLQTVPDTKSILTYLEKCYRV